jgi:hypothetical protein
MYSYNFDSFVELGQAGPFGRKRQYRWVIKYSTLNDKILTEIH